MTVLSVKLLLDALERNGPEIDGTAETARFFMPQQDRTIVVNGRGRQTARRTGRPAPRLA